MELQNIGWWKNSPTQTIPLNGHIEPRSKFISIAGLYGLIPRSKMPKAREFQHWVNSNLLPQLTATGKYDMVTDAPMEQAQQMNAINQVYTGESAT